MDDSNNTSPEKSESQESRNAQAAPDMPVAGNAQRASDTQAAGEAHDARGPHDPFPKVDPVAAVENAKDTVVTTGEKIKADFVAGIKETEFELRQDKADYREFRERQKRKFFQTAEDMHHPKLIVDSAREKAKVTAGKLKDDAVDAAQAVTHPKKTALEIGQSIREGVADVESGVRKKPIPESAIEKKKLPIGLKIFGVLCILASLYNISGVTESIISLVHNTRAGSLGSIGTSTIVVLYVHLAIQSLLIITFILLGERMLRNRRRLAAVTTDAIFVLIVLGAICAIMLNGINWYLIGYGVLAVIMIALQAYIDPSLSEERRLHRKLRDMNLRQEGEEGTLGYDTTGKGYITLNFFNLFWIFVVCSVIGLAMETIVHFIFVAPGEYQDRAGLLFGPFSPIYGCGAVLMTVFLNRFHKSNVILIFLVAGIIGGLFEAFTSVFMQYAFGAVAWDYTGEFPFPLFGGRTCVFMMCCWGLLGVVWIKLLLPLMLRIVNLIPWDWRYGLTAVCAVLMLVDAVMTLQALDCWYERISDDPVTTPIQKFYDAHFDNAYMADRFQSMSIYPHDAVRGGK